MAWIESHQNVKDHKKTYLLMEALGVSKRDAIAIVHMIWWWCLDNALTGRIEVPPVALKAATEWEHDADKLVEGLITSGWLERHEEGGLQVHDWYHYCGSLVEKRLERKHFREKKTGPVRRPNISRAVAVRRPTVSVSVSGSIPKDIQIACPVPNDGTDNACRDGEAPSPTPPKIAIDPKPTPADLAELWNKSAHPNLPRVRVVSEAIKSNAKCRLRDYPEQAFWEDLISRVNKSPLLRGEKGDWKASFDWIVRPTNFAKIVNGNYDYKPGR